MSAPESAGADEPPQEPAVNRYEERIANGVAFFAADGSYVDLNGDRYLTPSSIEHFPPTLQ